VYPLPELDSSDFGGSCVFHEVIKRDTSVSTHPSSGVSETSLYVLLHTFDGNFAGYFSAQQIGSGDYDFRTENMVLENQHKSEILKNDDELKTYLVQS
jgi:hypothetical protein